MTVARNAAISGDYKGVLTIGFTCLKIHYGFFKTMRLNRDTVERLETVTGEQQKSAMSAFTRGAVGGFLLGPAGMIAGSLSAKTNSIYRVAVYFRDGKRSLLEVDGNLYSTLMRFCF